MAQIHWNILEPICHIIAGSKINILKTSAVSLIRVILVRTNWSQPKPYRHTEGIARLVIWKPCNCNWVGTYCNRFLILIEDLKVVILRTCAASGYMAFWGEQNVFGWFLRLEPKSVAWTDGICDLQGVTLMRPLWLEGMSAMFHL